MTCTDLPNDLFNCERMPRENTTIAVDRDLHRRIARIKIETPEYRTMADVLDDHIPDPDN